MLRRSVFISFIVVAFLFSINFFTLKIFPLVWNDEVMFVDPAANLVLDGRLVSRAWTDQSEFDMWAANAPVYSIILAMWIKIFGLSITGVRSFGLILTYLAVVILLFTAKREHILTQTAHLVIVAIIVLFDYGIALNYRGGRYDGIGIFLVSLVAWGVSPKRSPRLLVLFLSCVAIPASGIHLATFTVIAFISAFVAFRKAAVPSIIAGLSGLALGSIVFLGWYALSGALETFLLAAARLRTIASGSTPKDPSFCLIVVAALIQAARFHQNKWWQRSELVFLSLVGFSAPIIMYSLGRFPVYYTWMSVIPLSTFIFSLQEMEKSNPKSPISRWLLAGSLFLACILGLPLQLASGLFWKDLRNPEVVDKLAQQIHADDTVICDWPAYYAARSSAGKTYLFDYVASGKLSESQRRNVSAMIIQPQQFEELSHIIGGRWEAGNTTPRPENWKRAIKFPLGDKLFAFYDLQIFRRRSE